MRIIIILINSLLAFPVFGLENLSQIDRISSTIAVSETGRFAVSYFSPLIIDKEKSSEFSNFIAYQDPVTKHQIMIGSIPGDNELSDICKHPIFLQNEKIANVSMINDNHINYYTTNQYKGCIINFSQKQSAIIVTIPNPFVSQDGEQIKHIGIVANTEEVNQLKNNISFTISAKDFFINLLQLSETFSPFNNEIDWHLIRDQGLAFIGSETITCRGLSAAAKFLVPALNKHDFHSFITLNGLGTSLCPAPPLPEDEGMKKWFAVPESTRSAIIKYSSVFHSYALNQHIAYLYIPAINDAFNPVTINEKITEGRNAINHAMTDSSCGLIVDLRFNTGGSLVPMLLTLSEILQSGKLFQLGKDTSIYLSEDRNKLFVNDTTIYGQYDGALPNLTVSKPVAILTNWMTGSSGSISSLALHDNVQQAKVFGTKTSPTTSVNGTFYLLDGNTLNLTVDRLYDKNGNIVPLELPADEEFQEVHFETVFDPAVDITLNAAKNWLETLPSCRSYGSLDSTALTLKKMSAHS